jgi:ribosomal protein S18 acetylase RimI-like enzyme
MRRHQLDDTEHVIETILGQHADDAVREAARLLHDFNREYDEPTPPPDEIAARLLDLLSDEHLVVLLAREHDRGTPVGVAVMRVHPSLWGASNEAYLAELYVVPEYRGHGYGRELITHALRDARERDVTYAFLVTSEDDRRAQRLYEAAGFRRTEGEGGPLMLAYERDLQPIDRDRAPAAPQPR